MHKKKSAKKNKRKLIVFTINHGPATQKKKLNNLASAKKTRFTKKLWIQNVKLYVFKKLVEMKKNQ